MGVMKTLLILLWCVLPLTAFGQGASVRSLNGVSTNQFLYDVSGVLSIKPGLRFLYDAGGTQKSLDWDARVAYDTVNVASVLWGARQVNDSLGAASMNWDTRTFSGSAWTFRSITNHTDVSSGAFATGNVWGYDGLTGRWTNGPPSAVIASTGTTNSTALTLRDPVIGDGNNGVATTNKAAFLRLFPTSVTNNGALTSAVIVGDGGRGIANTAVGATPIDGDGTATTFVQINNLAPGNIITQSTSFIYTNTQGLVSTNSRLSGTTLNGPTTNANVTASQLAGYDSNKVLTNIPTGIGLLLSGGVLTATNQSKTNVILTANISNGGSVIPTGTVQGFPVSGDAWTISGWSITAMGTSPTCTIDVWKIANGTALPTVANTIMGTKPALSTGNVIESSTLTAWTTSVAKGDIWGINVDAVSVATNIVFQIFGYR